ncbi:hypothetical protein ANN_22910 [Periplaneta americana]|uniref:Uncharacterized protein n=1 Tax=Periplaneta americana TaxID=6978 RepID=A0ABQ8SJQ8_PERAM|nr:hypothetical protein ANN_22910 [Periplaneta americana]
MCYISTVSTASWCDVSANSREKAESHALAGLKVIEISPATSKHDDTLLPRLHREAIKIYKHNNCNRKEEGVKLNKCWYPVLNRTDKKPLQQKDGTQNRSSEQSGGDRSDNRPWPASCTINMPAQPATGSVASGTPRRVLRPRIPLHRRCLPQLQTKRLFKVCHGSLYAVMWLADEPREFNLPTLPQRCITYEAEKLPSKYGIHSEEYGPIRTVTLEEQMICGALQTLNEEACEDVMEETEEEVEVPYKATTLAPPSELGESTVIINLRTRSMDKDESDVDEIHKVEDLS